MKLASTPVRMAFKNVLAASDLSPDSKQALAWAQRIARRYGSKLVVTHVISPAETALVPPEYWGSSLQMIDEAAKRQLDEMNASFEGVPHEMRLEHGRLPEIISAEIEELNIDLLVLGTHGREGVGRFAMGSAAEELLRRVRCPVLTVGPRVTAPVGEEAGFQEIVLATNFGQESLAAAPYAISLAEEFQARLTLLNVMNDEDFDPPTDPQVAMKSRMERLRKIVPADADLACKPDCIVEFGNGAEQILRVARERSADLIVLGAKPAIRHMVAATHISAATAHNVIARATCPVMTVCG
jgi:nucleotide-binding universal stress UspA family protein